jgi:hypothetical protein
MRWAEDFGGSKETHAQAQAALPSPRPTAGQQQRQQQQRQQEEDDVAAAFMDPPFSPITSEEEAELLAMLEHRLGGPLSSDDEEEEEGGQGGWGQEEKEERDEHAGQVLDDRRVTTLANLLLTKHLTNYWLKVRTRGGDRRGGENGEAEWDDDHDGWAHEASDEVQSPITEIVQVL